jgi:hypothetical protein
VGPEAADDLRAAGRVRARALRAAIAAALRDTASAPAVFEIVEPLRGLPLGGFVVVFRPLRAHETPTGQPGLLVVRVLSFQAAEALAASAARRGRKSPSVADAAGELVNAVVRQLRDLV